MKAIFKKTSESRRISLLDHQIPTNKEHCSFKECCQDSDVPSNQPMHQYKFSRFYLYPYSSKSATVSIPDQSCLCYLWQSRRLHQVDTIKQIPSTNKQTLKYKQVNTNNELPAFIFISLHNKQDKLWTHNIHRIGEHHIYNRECLFWLLLPCPALLVPEKTSKGILLLEQAFTMNETITEHTWDLESSLQIAAYLHSFLS